MTLIKFKANLKLILLISASLVGTSLSLHSKAWSLFDSTPFAENDIVLPTGMPDPKNIKGLLVTIGSPLFFGIDTTSIQLGSDKVMRYVMAIKNPSGTQQIKYEGIRCDTVEYKVFGHVNPEGKWVLEGTDWKPIPKGGYNQYQATLAWEGFCSGNGPNYNTADVLRQLPFTQVPWTTTPIF